MNYYIFQVYWSQTDYQKYIIICSSKVKAIAEINRMMQFGQQNGARRIDFCGCVEPSHVHQIER